VVPLGSGEGGGDVLLQRGAGLADRFARRQAVRGAMGGREEALRRFTNADDQEAIQPPSAEEFTSEHSTTPGEMRSSKP
jgi:hypothetical protein